MIVNAMKFFVLFIIVCCYYLSTADDCKWTGNKNNSPEVYYVNMDKSISRKETIENHLKQVGFRYYRVRGLTYQEIYLPPDIENTWRTVSCKLQTTWIPPNKLDSNYNFTSSEYSSYTAYTASLCGRGKGRNTPGELGCTASHLVAMHKAIYSTTAKSRYALIVEDDVYFPFNIDFNALVESVPGEFGILQLFNSNLGFMQSNWGSYVYNNENLWIKNHAKKGLGGTCAYLIDRFVMKPIIDVLVVSINGWIQLKIIAGIAGPCVPSECCGGKGHHYTLGLPCVFAPRGYQADSFLYLMTTTYTLSIPIITNGQGGNQSTFHQDHVSMVHKNAFRRQRQYINELILKNITSPNFIKPACKIPLDIDMM